MSKFVVGATWDDDKAGEDGDNHNLTGVGTDAEIYFLGSVTLDNGITVGARVELEAESRDRDDGNGDQIDAAYAYFSGGFGEIRIGSLAGAAGNMYMLPPGSSANFGPYSPNTIGSVNSPGVFDPEGMLAGKDKSQKIVYYSPNWSGFTFGVSYTPEDNFETQTDGAEGTFHPTRNTGDAANNFALGLHYAYEGEGWGLTTDGTSLIMSNGSDQIVYRDPATFDITRTISVTDGGNPIANLNELEYIDGVIWANVWRTNLIARIDPETGTVIDWLDLSSLDAEVSAEQPYVDVLNGIASNPDTGTVFITGKNWPTLFEIELVPEN